MGGTLFILITSFAPRPLGILIQKQAALRTNHYIIFAAWRFQCYNIPKHRSIFGKKTESARSTDKFIDTTCLTSRIEKRCWRTSTSERESEQHQQCPFGITWRWNHVEQRRLPHTKASKRLRVRAKVLLPQTLHPWIRPKYCSSSISQDVLLTCSRHLTHHWSSSGKDELQGRVGFNCGGTKHPLHGIWRPRCTMIHNVLEDEDMRQCYI